MRKFSVRTMFAAISLVALCLPAFAGVLDDYYLQQFGEPSSYALQKAVLESVTGMEQAQCGTPLKRGLQRDWNYLEPATQKVLAKQLAAPVLSGTEQTLLSASGRYLIHYTASGADAVPSAAWVQTVADTFDAVAAAYVARGWQLAPTTGGAPYDVYLRNLAPQRLYGVTTANPPSSGISSPSYIEIDNDFTESVYVNSTGGPYSPEQSLQITAAHEYHHAIQYGYNYFFDIWYAEATASWHEDELYDNVNQLYNYVPAWFNNSRLPLDTDTSTSTGGGYGRWIFNRFLAERFGSAIVKANWDKLAATNPVNGQDIPMAPVIDNVLSTQQNSSLGAEFFGFAKRVYDRNWSTHTADIGRIHLYTPAGTYVSYPVNTSSSPAPAVTLPHYSFAFYKFAPSSAAADLTITVTKSSGIQTAVFKKAGGVISEVAANTGGSSYTISGFGSLSATSDEVVLLVVNTSNADNQTASFSTDGSSVGSSSGGGGGGGGCFIATAAYGSYLHPQVQVLRNFRDTCLLTNAPCRAFVALYYRLSPPAADFIAQHDTLRLLVRLLLTPLIFAVAHAGIVALTSATCLAGWLLRKACLR
jgi:hypothetical protein